MSRLHPKKGVDILLKAWSIYVDNHQGSTLKIAGTGKDDYIRHLRNLVTELNINDSVFFLGMLRNECREDAFKSSDIFVLPSHTENFGMAILEALTYGLPVITTTGTPWKDIKTMRAGWWIDLDLEKLVSALEDASSMSRSDYTKKSHNAKQIAEKYTCDVIADRMNAAYCWVLSAADNPDIYQSKDALG